MWSPCFALRFAVDRRTERGSLDCLARHTERKRASGLQTGARRGRQWYAESLACKVHANSYASDTQLGAYSEQSSFSYWFTSLKVFGLLNQGLQLNGCHRVPVECQWPARFRVVIHLIWNSNAEPRCSISATVSPVTAATHRSISL
jgi:hypothetical protein